jgi:hypothetical protein
MIGLLGISLGATFAWGAPGGEEPSIHANFSRLTEADVVRFAGAAPERCVHAAAGRKLCTWKLDGRLMRRGLPTEVASGVMLVCEFATDPDVRAEVACGAHLADSRTQRDGSATPPSDLPHVSASPPSQDDSALRQNALVRLARSRSVGDLSQLVGDAPDRCETGADIQICTWSIGERREGHALFSAIAAGDEALRLRCEIPLDGRPRADRSCTVYGGN